MLLRALRNEKTWRWISFLFTLVVYGSALVRFYYEYPVHFELFMRAGNALWNRKISYQSTFGTGIGYLFYSPTVVLYLFGPLSLLPRAVSLQLYCFVSLIVYAWGFRTFAKRAGFRTRELSIVWILALGPFYSAMINSKLELLMVGIWLWSLARGSIAGITLLTNWKIQPLPALLLYGVDEFAVSFKKGILYFFKTSFWLSLWFLLPLLLLPLGLYLECLKTWVSSLSAFSMEAWAGFENIFHYPSETMGLNWKYSSVIAMTLASGVLMALWIYFFPNPAKRRPAWMLLATGFIAAFSPLGQNNALILVVPLILLLWKINPRLTVLLGILFAFAYSDFLPQKWADYNRGLGLKSWASLLSAIYGTWRISKLKS